jgi:zinc transport system ATP-binding protein
MLSPAPLLTAHTLRVGYDGRALLPALSFEVRRGELWAVLGRNGAGKTTLLRTLLGLLRPVEGEVQRLATHHVGYVPQRSELDLSVPSRVIDMVRTGRDRGWSFFRPRLDAASHEAVEQAMRDTHTLDLAKEQFADLSEGQKQRVLFARALVSGPALLVLDEPTSAMDRENEAALYALIDELREERDLAVLVISHDIERALQAATHVAHVDKDLGIAAAGPKDEVVHRPHFIRQFGAFFEAISDREEDD